jgi:hypothetical protein
MIFVMPGIVGVVGTSITSTSTSSAPAFYLGFLGRPPAVKQAGEPCWYNVVSGVIYTLIKAL